MVNKSKLHGFSDCLLGFTKAQKLVLGYELYVIIPCYIMVDNISLSRIKILSLNVIKFIFYLAHIMHLMGAKKKREREKKKEKRKK